MGTSEKRRVVTIVGVPLVQTNKKPASAPLLTPLVKPPVKPPVGPLLTPPVKPPLLKRVRITEERGNLTRSGYIYKAMTNLGKGAAQLKYDVIIQNELQKVINKQATPEGGIVCTISDVAIPVSVGPSGISARTVGTLGVAPYPVRAQRLYIKWEKQQIGDDAYAKGQSRGLILRHLGVPHLMVPPVETPPVAIPTPPVAIPPKEWYFDYNMLYCKELSPGDIISKSAHRFTDKRECNIALIKYLRVTRRERQTTPVETARRTKRKISVRAEKLMQEVAFPKAVREAIEKGLEQKDAPRDIERIIEKVAKTNVPDYIILETLAKRIGRGGIVQYKVKTNKGVIVYENADEITKNATLGMKTPTGEIIPLQIKVIR